MIEYWKNLDLRDLFYVNENGLVCCEEWRDVPNYEGHYKISDLGRVKSLERFKKNHSKFQKVEEIILVQNDDGHGYLKVCLSVDRKRKHVRTNVLVAMAFLGHIPDGTNKVVVDHVKSEQIRNNTVFNLQLITNRRNSNKDKSNLLNATGVYLSHKKYNARIWWNGKHRNLGSYDTIEKAKEVRDSAFDILENGGCILHLIKDRTINGKPSRVKDLTEEDVLEIRRLNGIKTIFEIANLFEISRCSVKNIIDRKTWNHI